MHPSAVLAAMQWYMDSHRSFEFDRYPFDDTSNHEPSCDVLDDLNAYYAADITHGMEIGIGQVEFRAEGHSSN
jgi:hypothetical protein